jgi:HAD superfamily hydrolase (TIGR01458 family)
MAQIKAILFDIDGVLHVGDQSLPGARRAIELARSAGVALCFLTNTTRKPRRTILARLAAMDLDVRERELLTPSRAALDWLSAEGRPAHLLIHPALGEDFEAVRDGPDAAVVIGDAADGFTYAALNACFRRLMDGAPFLALARNRYFRESDGISLDMGAYVVGLEYATGREAITLGKPSHQFFETALSIVGCEADDATMIGDDVDADVNGAIAAGLSGILVRTGKYNKDDDARLVAGGRIEDDVAAAVDRLLEECR